MKWWFLEVLLSGRHPSARRARSGLEEILALRILVVWCVFIALFCFRSSKFSGHCTGRSVASISNLASIVKNSFHFSSLLNGLLEEILMDLKYFLVHELQSYAFSLNLPICKKSIQMNDNRIRRDKLNLIKSV